MSTHARSCVNGEKKYLELVLRFDLAAESEMTLVVSDKVDD